MNTAAVPVQLQVHPRLRAIELRRSWLLGLGGVIIGGGLAVFAFWLAWGSVDHAWRYARGVPAASSKLVRLSVKRGLIAQVSGSVSYADARGGVHVHELRCLRVLATPEPGDLIEVRYSPHEPLVAVSSWERGSVPHELAVALVVALLVALLAAGVLR